MEPLFYLVLNLLSAGAPWLAAVIVAAIAVARVGPIHLNLSIGERLSQPENAAPSHRLDDPASTDQRISAGNDNGHVTRRNNDHATRRK